MHVERSKYQRFLPGQSSANDTFAKLRALDLPDMSGKSYLDVACNTGFFCMEAERRGPPACWGSTETGDS